jgi:hypothetical protein
MCSICRALCAYNPLRGATITRSVGSDGRRVAKDAARPVDAMADYEKTLNNGDRKCLELAESLRTVICLEEVFRSVGQTDNALNSEYRC